MAKQEIEFTPVNPLHVASVALGAVVAEARRTLERPLPTTIIGAGVDISKTSKPEGPAERSTKAVLAQAGTIVFDAAHPYMERAYSIISAFR